MHEVGFEPTRLTSADLKSAPLTTRAFVQINKNKKIASCWDRTSDIAVNSRTL